MNIIEEVKMGIAFGRAVQELTASGKLQGDYQYLVADFEKARDLFQQAEALVMDAKTRALNTYNDLAPEIKALLAKTPVVK